MPMKAATMNLSPGRAVRRSSSERGYDATWQRFRRWYAAGHPAVCVRCNLAGPSRTMALDHIKPLAAGGERLAEGNVQWLCRGCHAVKTRADKGASHAKSLQNRTQ
mgnify:CR=1 FL=1